LAAGPIIAGKGRHLHAHRKLDRCAVPLRRWYKQQEKCGLASVDASRLPLDFAAIANWTPHPANDLPESDPNSLSRVLHYYMNKHAHVN